MSYEEALAQLEDAGFTNITAEASSTTSKDRDGMLQTVKVDGSTTFKEGDWEEKDVEILLTYYELEQYEVALNVDTEGEEGKPEFIVSTNLPDDVELTLTLSGDGDYSGQQIVAIEDGMAASSAFTTGYEEALPAGEYILAITMRMEDQPSGFFTGTKGASVLGSDGECMIGDYVVDDEDSGGKYIYAEFDYTSEYEEPEPVSKEELLQTIEDAVKEGFGDNCEVVMDDYGYTANVWQSGVAMLAMLAQTGASEYLDEWDSMVDSTEYAASSIKLLLMSAGYSDMMIVINIMNDQNTDYTLLTVVDGTTYYDYVNGIDLLGG